MIGTPTRRLLDYVGLLPSKATRSRKLSSASCPCAAKVCLMTTLKPWTGSERWPNRAMARERHGSASRISLVLGASLRTLPRR